MDKTAENSVRTRRRTQDKIFRYLMAVLTVAFIYCFGFRPSWLYMGTTTLGSSNWWVDNTAHYLFGIGLGWVFIYGDRLSIEPPRRWVLNIIGKCLLFGAIWEFAVELPFDYYIHPWLESSILPYSATNWQIVWDMPEKMQKGNTDTSIDLLLTFLGAMTGLLWWRFMWRPLYAFLLPKHAREELMDEFTELIKHARQQIRYMSKNFRHTRKEEINKKKQNNP